MKPQYTPDDLYDMFANQADRSAIAAMSDAELAGDIVGQLDGADYDKARFPLDVDGNVDAFAVAAMMKRIAAS